MRSGRLSRDRETSPGERLMERICRAVVPLLAEGFLADRLGASSEPGADELADVLDATRLLLFRLLFLFYAEGRGLLPAHDVSLQRLAGEIADRAGTVEAAIPERLARAYSARQYRLHDRLVERWRALEVLAGNARFLARHKVPDRHLAGAIDLLARDHGQPGGAGRLLDYGSLEVRHLGSIHERLIGHKLVCRQGEVALSNAPDQRRAAGSYYTPDHIVEHIVEQTIGPVLGKKLEALRATFHGRAPGLDDVEKLDLRVLDPAMGSGHFLVKAAAFLTGRLAGFFGPATRRALGRLKQHVLKRCLHGIDLDPLAVELARISLWLDSAAAGEPLSVLDENLRRGNALLEAIPADFDAVIGNPPYDVLAEKELGAGLRDLLPHCRRQAVFAPARGGKMNLYKLFVCLGVAALRPGGRLGYVVPMALLGDEQAAGVRRLLLDETALAAIEAFPQKDDPRNRVFPDAKLATCVVVTARGAQDAPFRLRTHPGRSIDDTAPALLLRRSEVGLYDPVNRPIVSCSQADWDLAVRLMSSGRMQRLGELARSYQGEVNETVERGRGHLCDDPAQGPRLLRGSNVALYALRPSSQGQAVFLLPGPFLEGKGPGAKAWHHRRQRVGFQRKAPQNNFRRLIACRIPAGEFCCESISYFPERESALPLDLLVGLLNSKLLEWYFRLGSSNAMINDYQVRNLPVPRFAPDGSEPAAEARFAAALAGRDWQGAFGAIEPLLSRPPFSASVAACLVQLVRRIVEVEARRGAVARSERSALAPAAQPCQDLLDRILFRLAGLTDDEAAGLAERLARML